MVGELFWLVHLHRLFMISQPNLALAQPKISEVLRVDGKVVQEEVSDVVLVVTKVADEVRAIADALGMI
jgi:hypothetical protein